MRLRNIKLAAMRIIELASGDAILRVAPGLGGAIVSYTWRQRPVLRPTPASALATRNVRLASCYPLVPYSNRIRDAMFSFRGREYALERNFGAHAIHGVGWQRAWSIDAAKANRAQLTLAHDPRADGAGAWPWPFRATQTFELSSTDTVAVLSTTLTIANTGTQPFPFGLGWHPFFSADAKTTVGFGAQAVWQNDATQLPVQRTAVPAAWPFRDARPLDGLAIDNVFAGWAGRADVTNASTGIRATLSADRACGRLVVYAPPRADFIALEPVTHETDAFNRSAAGAQDVGFRTLAPGCAFSCTMRVAVSASD
jgi:aldose 1-epimerase